MSEQSGPPAAGSPYPPQPRYPYGQAPVAPRKRRRGLWPGITGAVVVVIIAMVSGCASTSTPKPPSATGPSACVLPGTQASGSGPWKLVMPSKLCGEPRDTKPQDQPVLSSTEFLISASDLNPPGVGNYTSGVTQDYQLEHANPQGGTAFYRNIAVQALKGKFNPKTAISVLGSTYTGDSNSTLRNVPAGPHGGLMACTSPTSTETECVWATTTTAGLITVNDNSGELTGSHGAANAVWVRDAVEVPSS